MPRCVRARRRRPPAGVYGDGGAKTSGEQSGGAASPAPNAHCAGVDMWLAVPVAPLSTPACEARNDRIRRAKEAHGALCMGRGDRLDAAKCV